MDKMIHFDEELDSQFEENQDTNIEENVTESSELSFLEYNEAHQTMEISKTKISKMRMI